MKFQTFLVTVLIVGLLLAGAGFLAGPTTVGLFTDSETTEGSIQAAGSFATTPPNACAYDDVNGDGIWNQGEPTYDETELYSFDDRSVSLVIPKDCGPIENSGDIDISAGSVSAETDLVANGLGSLSISATDGAIDLQNQQLLSNFGVSVSASGSVNMNSTAVLSRFWGGGIFNPTGIDISGNSISTVNAEIGANRKQIQLTATGGNIDGTGMSLTAPGRLFSDGNVQLESNGDMELETAEIDAGDDITVDLTSPDNTLFVDEASVSDSDDTLVYTPPNVTAEGMLSSGSLSPSSTTLAMASVQETPTRSSNMSREELLPEEPTDWEALGERLNVTVTPPT